MKKFVLLIGILAIVLIGCDKETTTPDRTTKAQVAVVDNDNAPARDIEWNAARQMAALKGVAQGCAMPAKGIDTTANVKARLALWPGTGSSYQWLVFDISISNPNATAPLNALSVAIKYTGAYTPAQGQGFVHNLTSYCIDWSNGVLLENSVGQYSYIAWYSLTPYQIASSTATGGTPIVCAIPVFGTSGTITFETIELSPDGNNNYIVSVIQINQ